VPNATTLAFVIGITTALPISAALSAGRSRLIAMIESPLAAL